MKAHLTEQHMASVSEELDLVREAMEGEAALLLAPPRSGSGYALASASGTAIPAGWEPYEALASTPALPATPCVLRDLVLRPQRTASSLALASAVCVPFSAGHERGWMIVGVLAGRMSAIAPGAEAELRRVASAFSIQRVKERESLYENVAAATACFYRTVGSRPDLELAMQATVSTARSLVRADSAYLSMPHAGDQAVHGMYAFDNVRTAGFRSLTIRLGEGQGGLARALSRPVLVADYAEDPRLRNPPLEVVQREGFRSAIATPLLVDDTAIACLYVANRTAGLFSEDDADRITLFGQHAAQLMSGVLAEDELLQLELERNRQELVFRLHETVVRSLVDIALRADGIRIGARARDELGSIAETARGALEFLRAALSEQQDLASPRRSLAEIGSLIRADVPTHGIPLNVTTDSSATLVDGAVSEGLVAVAREAVRNANLHSDGTRIEVSISDLGDQVRVEIEDDGRGMEASARRRAGHFGLTSMLRRMDAVGGRVAIGTSETGGVRVSAVAPS